MELRMKGKLLVSDIDGTLVTPGMTLPRENILAIKRFIDAGGLFTLATGRAHDSVRQFIKPALVNAPAIVSNGAVIYDYSTDEFLYSSVLSSNAFDLIKNIMGAFPHAGIEVHTPDTLYMIRQSPQSEQHITDESIAYTFAALEDIRDKEWIKILVAAEPRIIDKVVRHCDGLATDEFTFVRTGLIYYEIVSQGQNKGSTLKRLADMLNIDIKDTYAIGDFYNDIELLQTASVSAVAGSGLEELKKTCDFVSVDVYDGAVAAFIDYILR